MDKKPFLIPVHHDVTVYEPKVINKVALIDADRYKHLVTYRIYQKMMEEGLEHSKTLLNEIIEDYLSKDIFNVFKSESYVFCFSAPSKNIFRNSITQIKPYKGNRRCHDPYMYPGKFEDMAYVYEYIANKYFTLFDNNLEADDILSMLQNDDTFIFSHDKDLKQVPGYYWNIEAGDLFYISEEEANLNLISQVLIGDSTDNISGLEGFGAKGLEKLLKDANNPEMLFIKTMKLFIDKYGLRNGIDSFCENWVLVSCKFPRGDHFIELHKDKFYLRDKLISKLQNNGNTKT